MMTRIVRFYVDGFRAMRLGRTLWALVLVKLIVLFGVVKVFFFPDVLHTRFATDQERSGHVLENLTGGRAEKTPKQDHFMGGTRD